MGEGLTPAHTIAARALTVRDSRGQFTVSLGVMAALNYDVGDERFDDDTKGKYPGDKDETIRAVRGLQRECPSAQSPAYIAEHAHDIRRTLLRASFLALSGAAASRDAARKSRLIAARK